MSLKHIMLGLLRKPHCGYATGKEFQRSLGNFWSAELSQIYPLLQRMEDEGLLTSNESPSKIGPKKRLYKRSRKGKQALQSWLAEGPKVSKVRNSYLAQVFFLAELNDDDQALQFMEQLRSRMADRLALLESIEDEWRENNPGYPDNLPDEEFYPQLTIDQGLRGLRAIVEWCDESIRRIKARRRKRLKTA